MPMDTINGTVVNYIPIQVYKRNDLGQYNLEEYVTMFVRDSNGVYELIYPAYVHVQDNVPVGSLILAKATRIADSLITLGIYKLHSYRRINSTEI